MEMTPKQARHLLSEMTTSIAAFMADEFSRTAEFRRQLADRFPALAESHIAEAEALELMLATLDRTPVDTLARVADASTREAFAPMFATLMRDTGGHFVPANATEFFHELLNRVRAKEIE